MAEIRRSSARRARRRILARRECPTPPPTRRRSPLASKSGSPSPRRTPTATSQPAGLRSMVGSRAYQVRARTQARAFSAPLLNTQHARIRALGRLAALARPRGLSQVAAGAHECSRRAGATPHRRRGEAATLCIEGCNPSTRGCNPVCERLTLCMANATLCIRGCGPMHPRCNHTCIRSGASSTKTVGRRSQPKRGRDCRCLTCSSTGRPPRQTSRRRPLPPTPTHSRMAARPVTARLADSWAGWARWVARCAPLRPDSTRCRARALDAHDQSHSRRKPPTPLAAARWWAQAVTHQRP